MGTSGTCTGTYCISTSTHTPVSPPLPWYQYKYCMSCFLLTDSALTWSHRMFDKRTADSGQRTADSGQRTADSGQRTADSGQRTADSRQRTHNLVLVLVHCTSACASISARITSTVSPPLRWYKYQYSMLYALLRSPWPPVSTLLLALINPQSLIKVTYRYTAIKAHTKNFYKDAKAILFGLPSNLLGWNLGKSFRKVLAGEMPIYSSDHESDQNFCWHSNNGEPIFFNDILINSYSFLFWIASLYQRIIEDDARWFVMSCSQHSTCKSLSYDSDDSILCKFSSVLRQAASASCKAWMYCSWYSLLASSQWKSLNWTKSVCGMIYPSNQAGIARARTMNQDYYVCYSLDRQPVVSIRPMYQSLGRYVLSHMLNSIPLEFCSMVLLHLVWFGYSHANRTTINHISSLKMAHLAEQWSQKHSRLDHWGNGHNIPT